MSFIFCFQEAVHKKHCDCCICQEKKEKVPLIKKNEKTDAMLAELSNVKKIQQKWLILYKLDSKCLSIKDLYQVQETWEFFFLNHIQLCVPLLEPPPAPSSPQKRKENIKKNILKRYYPTIFLRKINIFFPWKHKKTSSKIAHNRPKLFFQYCQKGPSLARQLKRHINFLMFVILNTNLC